jgi:hypothetical protein
MSPRHDVETVFVTAHSTGNEARIPLGGDFKGFLKLTGLSRGPLAAEQTQDRRRRISL